MTGLRVFIASNEIVQLFKNMFANLVVAALVEGNEPVYNNE